MLMLDCDGLNGLSEALKRTYTASAEDAARKPYLNSAIESVGTFPDEQATLQCGYMVLTSLGPDRKRWPTGGTIRSRAPFDVFPTVFDGRLTPVNHGSLPGDDLGRFEPL